MSLLRRAVPLEDQIALDRLLDGAFAPARRRKATTSAARVRARVAWEKDLPVSRGWRAVSLLGRVGEASLAVGMAAILLTGSLGTVGGAARSVQPVRGGDHLARPRVALDDLTFLRLLRLGHTALLIDDPGRRMGLRSPEDEAESVITIRERHKPPASAPAPRPSADDGDLLITVGERPR